MKREHVTLRKKLVLVARRRESVTARPVERALARPNQNLHPESFAVTRNDTADPTVPVNSKRFAAQVIADADLPLSRLERRHLLGHLAHRCKYQRPCKFRGGIRRCAGVLARRYNDSQLRAGIDIDVRVDAALAYQLESLQSLQQWLTDLGPLAYQDQHLGVLQSFGERIDFLDVVVPDFDLVTRQLFVAFERAEGVVIIVKNGDLHHQKFNVTASFMLGVVMDQIRGPSLAITQSFCK